MNPRMAGIPVNDYKQIAKDFNPVNFDAKKIAKLAKDADDVLAIYPNVEAELITEFGVVTNADQKNIRWMEKFGE